MAEIRKICVLILEVLWRAIALMLCICFFGYTTILIVYLYGPFERYITGYGLPKFFHWTIPPLVLGSAETLSIYIFVQFRKVLLYRSLRRANSRMYDTISMWTVPEDTERDSYLSERIAI